MFPIEQEGHSGHRRHVDRSGWHVMIPGMRASQVSVVAGIDDVESDIIHY